MEKSSGIKSCYIKAVVVEGTVKRDKRMHHEKFVMYTALGQKKVASRKLDDSLEMLEISPFWAVMLAGRDTAEMVNMIPHM